ncbi:MAG: nucleoside hydrolase [Gemmataceae bacterium]|nr:nucleoside hydrolase [Gemmataceae bacterium]MDW8266359.1 nucleoside hydrolase [Gemmataceae bacterium]
MPQKVLIIADPGIDGAYAIALAVHDPRLDVVAIAATAGNVSAEQATRNVHTLLEQIDPPRWPRLGASLPVDYEVDGQRMHGIGGLGGVDFPSAKLHHPHYSDKLIVDLVRQNPREITILVLGPLTMLARALDRDPELPRLVPRIVCMGGSWHEPGNATAVAEFHFFCDPLAARQVLHCGASITLIPLDVSRKLLLSPTELLELPAPESRTCRLLRQIVPFGIGATSNRYGIEGFYLMDVAGVAAVSLTGLLTTRPMPVDVETRGELTRGMSVVDARLGTRATPNVDLAIGIDLEGVRQYLRATLADAC